MSEGLIRAAHDVVIVGGGGAGLRAAIAIAETNPQLDVAVISKVYPMRSHTVSAEGGAAGVIARAATGSATRTRSRRSSARRRASCSSSSTGAARGAGSRTVTSRSARSAA